MDSEVATQYRADYATAFNACRDAVNRCGYAVGLDDRHQGLIPFEAPRRHRLPFVSVVRLAINIFDDGDGTVEISIGSQDDLNMGEGPEAIARVFQEIGKVLGKGEVISGTLYQLGFWGEVQRAMAVLMIFGGAVGLFIAYLLLFQKR